LAQKRNQKKEKARKEEIQLSIQKRSLEKSFPPLIIPKKEKGEKEGNL
jgi:hypothetical protein